MEGKFQNTININSVPTPVQFTNKNQVIHDGKLRNSNYY